MGGWIDKRDRLPMAEDADATHCVLAWHMHNGAMVIGWHQVERSPYFTHWQAMPEPPEGCDPAFKKGHQSMGVD